MIYLKNNFQNKFMNNSKTIKMKMNKMELILEIFQFYYLMNKEIKIYHNN